MIIQSLLDTDMYKLTMMQAVLHAYPSAQVSYEFICRTPNVDLTPIIPQLKEEIKYYCSLRYTQEEILWLKETLPYLKPDFLELLRIFQPCEDFVYIQNEQGKLVIRITGSWLHTINFEVPILALVEQLYYRHLKVSVVNVGIDLLKEKLNSIKLIPEFKFADFGTRRRASHMWHEIVIDTILNHIPKNLVGTSNLYFAKKYNIKPIGTHAHEWFMAHQGLVRIEEFQKTALQAWADEYRGELGIALTDTINSDVFLRDFDKYFAKLFDGVRHDSGDPFIWGEKFIKHYEQMGIVPKTKTLVFSDGLTFPKAIEIFNHFKSRINVSFGIGTNLTNDIGYEPLSIVIKMVECNRKKVAKISDEPGKSICSDLDQLAYYKKVFNL